MGVLLSVCVCGRDGGLDVVPVSVAGKCAVGAEDEPFWRVLQHAPCGRLDLLLAAGDDRPVPVKPSHIGPAKQPGGLLRRHGLGAHLQGAVDYVVDGGDILATKERDYVQAAQAAGATDFHLILRHILPNAIFPTLVVLSLDMGAIVLSFAALSFLGIGVQEGYTDWGQIVSFARSWILSLDTYWYIIVYPGTALLLYGLGWNLVGDALRDILDPKLRGKR